MAITEIGRNLREAISSAQQAEEAKARQAKQEEIRLWAEETAQRLVNALQSASLHASVLLMDVGGERLTPEETRKLRALAVALGIEPGRFIEKTDMISYGGPNEHYATIMPLDLLELLNQAG